jgi:hypothetical protein
LQVVAAAVGSAIKRERLLLDRVAVERAAAEERTRIARELHDTLAQGLAGIVMQLGAARAKLGAAGRPPGRSSTVWRASRASRWPWRAARSRCCARTRPRPPRGSPPPGGRGGGGPCRVPRGRRARRHGRAAPRPPEVEFELLRVAQAALANAAQHAHAARIAVTLDFGAGDAPALRIVVADDGRGFDPAAPRPGRFGLVGHARARGARGRRAHARHRPRRGHRGRRGVAGRVGRPRARFRASRLGPLGAGRRRSAGRSAHMSAGPGGGAGGPGRPIRVLVADDHALMRGGVVAVLRDAPGLAVVAEAADGAEAVALYARHRPDVALIDLKMPASTAPASWSRCARATRTRGSSS